MDALSEKFAHHLAESAEDLVERWIDWLQERVASRSVRVLPRDALRNHIPPVLRGIAKYVRAPLAAARSEMLGHLELHARLRREQGYDLGELLAEFDGLAHIVDGWTAELLRTLDDVVDGVDAVGVFQRLTTGLRAIGFVTVDVFRDAELDQQVRTSERLEEFARTIAHEIRNPLHTLALGLNALRSPPVDADESMRRHHLDMMETALRRAADLLDNIRQLALIESGRGHGGQLQRLPTLHQVTLEELASVADRRSVHVEVDGDVPDVSVDTLAYQLSLVNLVTNSIKYADPDKESSWVRIRYWVDSDEHDADDLVVEVKDNGLGIAEEYRDRVFKRHVRAHPGVADGTGLGLAITRQVVLEKGGRVSLASTPGEGTEVTFRLPCLAGSSTHRGAEEPPRSIVSLAVSRQLRRPAPEAEE